MGGALTTRRRPVSTGPALRRTLEARIGDAIDALIALLDTVAADPEGEPDDPPEDDDPAERDGSDEHAIQRAQSCHPLPRPDPDAWRRCPLDIAATDLIRRHHLKRTTAPPIRRR